MITSDTNFRGNFDSIEAVWEAIPYGGVEGDYLNIQGVKYRWNKYLTMWENAEVVTETPARETETFDEDVNMQNNLTVAGVLRAKEIVAERFRAWNPKGNYDATKVYSINDLVYDTNTKAAYLSMRSNNIGHPVDENDESYEEGWWMEVQTIGVPKGDFSLSSSYNVGDIVYDSDTNSSYLSLRADNMGHAVTDETWWMKVLDGSYVNTMVEELEQAIAQAIEDAQGDISELISDSQATINAAVSGANSAAQAANTAAANAEAKIDWVEEQVGSLTAYEVATALDETSIIPVQNKVVTQAINNLSENLQDVEEDILHKLGGQENIPLVIENGKGWKADLTDITDHWYKRSIVDIVAGDTYILSFRTAGGANKTCWADDNLNVIGSPINGGQNMKQVAPTGATKLYISTNTTGTPNTMKVAHIIDSQYVKVYDPAEYLLLDDTMSNASVWKKDQYYAGDGVFSVANNILTINKSSGRKFVQRTLQVSDKYDANAWYRFSFTLRRTTSTYKNRIQIGTCYASTAGTNHDYYDMIMPTTSFKTYSFIGKIYALYGMIKIGAETAFDTIEVSEVLVEKLTDEEYKSLDYLNPLGITYGQSLQKIIDKYPRVHLPAGTTELSYPLEIPNGHTIVGAVGGTTLKLVEGTTCILLSNKQNVTISNISFVGEAAVTPADVSSADIKSRTGEGTTSGICLQTNVNRNIVIDKCKFTNFSKAGIYSHNPFNYTYSQFLRVTNCCAMNCWCGITFDERAEYNIVSDCAFIYCQYGALVIGGNNKFSNCAFEANGVGFVVNGTTDGSTTAANNSHGIIVNSSFNHCISYGVFVFKAESGFTFTGCHAYGSTSSPSKGGIYISNSRGVNYNGGVIGCQIDIDATMSGLNMISDSLFDGGSYNSGTINGDKSKLSMHGNRDYRGIIDKATVNNDL